MRLASSFAALLIGFALPVTAMGQSTDSFDPKQEEAIGEIVRTYILENPDVILEAIQILQAREEQAREAAATAALSERADELYDDPDSVVWGNPDGDVVLVEFFDYQCGYCKSVHTGLMDTVATDGNVRFVFKELPILGPESEMASRAAIASRTQGMYVEFQDALMRHRGRLNERVVMRLASSIGLDVDILQSEMNSGEVTRIIDENRALAQALGINGTPAFVLQDQIIPGALPTERLRQMIAEARAEG